MKIDRAALKESKELLSERHKKTAGRLSRGCLRSYIVVCTNVRVVKSRERLEDAHWHYCTKEMQRQRERERERERERKRKHNAQQ